MKNLITDNELLMDITESAESYVDEVLEYNSIEDFLFHNSFDWDNEDDLLVDQFKLSVAHELIRQAQNIISSISKQDVQTPAFTDIE